MSHLARLDSWDEWEARVESCLVRAHVADAAEDEDDGALKPDPGRSKDEIFKTGYENVRRDAKALGEALFHIGGTDLMLDTIHLYVPNMPGLHRSFDYFFDGIGGWKC